MKVVVAQEIPFLKGLLEPFCEVVYLPGNKISNRTIQDADALLVRSATLCDSALLEGSNVSFIGTASIGHDHIDANFCEARNITWVNAPSCKSRAVAQYVTSSLLSLAKQESFELSSKTLGIIGVGQVGQKVERNARLLGMNVLLNDPPRARNEGEKNFTSLDSLLDQSDIISLHPTMEKEGPEKTYHLLNQDFFERLSKPIYLINAARGSMVDTVALKAAIQSGKVLGCALDCWENEPLIDRDLLEMSLIATPHIAGYTYEGKACATKSIVEQFCQFFNLPFHWEEPEIPEPEKAVIKLPRNCPTKLSNALLQVYDPLKDTEQLKASPEQFERLRNQYALRRDYKATKVLNLSENDAQILRAMGLQVALNARENIL